MGDNLYVVLVWKASTRLFFLLPQFQRARNWPMCTTFELEGGTMTETKWCHFYVFSLHSFIFQKGLITYVGLPLLTSKLQSLLFDPQVNAFLSWANSYTAFHNRSNCWVCRVHPSSSVECFTWWIPLLQGKDFVQLCEYLHQQQSYVMPLLDQMTSNNSKMDWYNTLYLNYGHNVTFNFYYVLTWFNDYFALYL